MNLIRLLELNFYARSSGTVQLLLERLRVLVQSACNPPKKKMETFPNYIQVENGTSEVKDLKFDLATTQQLSKRLDTGGRGLVI